MERFGFESQLQQEKAEKPQEHSSKRLMLALDTLVKLQVGEVSIHGKEHLTEIPDDRKVIIASTHLSDLDMPLAVYALGNDLDLAIVNMSVHHSWNPKSGEPSTYAGLVAAGKENFIPVDFEKDSITGEKRSSAFNAENFQPMLEALDHNKRVLIAAHNPSHDFELDKAGYGAAYLAELGDALILPVAVKLESDGQVGMYGTATKTFLKKPNATVEIGSPFELTKIEGIEQFRAILEKRKQGEKLTAEEREYFMELSRALRAQSEALMEKIAALLPQSAETETKKS
jgi:hypothetical protein